MILTRMLSHIQFGILIFGIVIWLRIAFYTFEYTLNNQIQSLELAPRTVYEMGPLQLERRINTFTSSDELFYQWIKMIKSLQNLNRITQFRPKQYRKIYKDEIHKLFLLSRNCSKLPCIGVFESYSEELKLLRKSFVKRKMNLQKRKIPATQHSNVYRHYRSFLTEFATECEHGINKHDTIIKNLSTKLPTCPCIPERLDGLVPILPLATTWSILQDRHTEMNNGFWQPAKCKSRHKVALIVPYRSREIQLRVFLRHMLPFLQKQLITFGIYVIEQTPGELFNRGMLLNIGFVESLEDALGWDCYVFHDADLLPEVDVNFYSCPRQAHHMSTAVNSMGYKLMYESLFGGVSAVTTPVFVAVNGFPNRYWGWGGEDDDMAIRLKASGYNWTHYPAAVGRYTMLGHRKQPPAMHRIANLAESQNYLTSDGLNNLTYRLCGKWKRRLYTHILVNIGNTSDTSVPPSSGSTNIRSSKYSRWKKLKDQGRREI